MRGRLNMVVHYEIMMDMEMFESIIDTVTSAFGEIIDGITFEDGSIYVTGKNARGLIDANFDTLDSLFLPKETIEHILNLSCEAVVIKFYEKGIEVKELYTNKDIDDYIKKYSRNIMCEKCLYY